MIHSVYIDLCMYIIYMYINIHVSLYYSHREINKLSGTWYIERDSVHLYLKYTGCQHGKLQKREYILFLKLQHEYGCNFNVSCWKKVIFGEVGFFLRSLHIEISACF